MTTQNVRSYNAIIKRAVARAEELAFQAQGNEVFGEKPIAGFCVLHGPTGGGKSSSLYHKGYLDGLPPALQQINGQGYQAILVTHRWNILLDMYRKMVCPQDGEKQRFRVSVIYGKVETCVACAAAIPLPHEMPETKIPDPHEAIKHLEEKKLLGSESAGLAQKIGRYVRKIQQLNSAVEYGQAHAPHIAGGYIQEQKKELEKACASLEKEVIDVLGAQQKHVNDLVRAHGEGSENVHIARKRLKDLRSNLWIRRLLPGITWHDEHQQLLIMTTHKLYYSFYDGTQKVRLNSPRLAGKVIFIDEFDYQADILQDLLAENQMLQSPPEFLGQLLRAGNSYLNRLSPLQDDSSKNIYDFLHRFISDLEKDLTENGIDLQEHRSLVAPDEGDEGQTLFNTSYLFRSDHLITSDRLLMRPLSTGYEVRKVDSIDSGQEESLFLDVFLRTLERHIRLFVLNTMSMVDTEDSHKLLNELCHVLFDSANDYRDSHNKKTVIRLMPGLMPSDRHAELEPLIKSNRLANTQASMFGLTCWMLERNRAAETIDRLRLDIRRAYLPTTPEGLLFSLASRNLVFGLSATAYIERAVGNFDLRWVEAALSFLAESRDPEVTESSLGIQFGERKRDWFTRPIPYVPDREDIQAQAKMIAALNKKKQRTRQTRLTTTVQNFSRSTEIEVEHKAIEVLGPDFFGDEKTGEKVVEYRKELLLKILKVIRLAGEKSDKHQGHLVFVNSIRFLRRWLETKEAEQSRGHVPWLQDDPGFSSQVAVDSPLVHLDEIFVPKLVHGVPVLLCLLTAANQKNPWFFKAYQAAFDTGRTVVVLTQTATATNGINLDFSLPDTTKAMDLTCLYIIEAKHYYFGSSSKSSQDPFHDLEMKQAGYQLRNLEKLVRGGELSHAEQERYIMPLMAREERGISHLNLRYKGTSDYIKNTAANVQQQVGRVERAWEPIAEIEILVDENIALVLGQFASLPNYLNYRDQVSDLNQQLLCDIEQGYINAGHDRITDLLIPRQTGEQAIQYIDDILVPAIRKSRQQNSANNSVELHWKRLGAAVLRFDYAWQFGSNSLGLPKDRRLLDWACVRRPGRQQLAGGIWYDPKTWQFFDEYRPGLRLHDPDRLYQPVREHEDIYDWFNKMGFRVSLSPPANELEENYVFHPLVCQRLLQGRVGEHAIRGLLYAHGIRTTDWLADKRALELYDFAVCNTPYRIDAKYWHHPTLDEAERQYRQWVESNCSDGNDPMGLVKRLKVLRSIEGEGVKLMVINLTSVTPRVTLNLFDATMNRVPTRSFTRADILVLGGCIVDNSWSDTDGFDPLVRLLIESQSVEESCHE